MEIDARLHGVVSQQPYPFLFATISGAHLYGFPSPDSDYDLRGSHILPLPEVVGLRSKRETIEVSTEVERLEIDLVSHDVQKFFSFLLKRNGYVLEQLYSPLIIHSTPGHAELKDIAKRCITRAHSHHYLGFAETEWKLFYGQDPRRVKPLLYVYRVLLTGIHLMRTGIVEANLLRLNEEARLPYIDDLVAYKLAEGEKSSLPDVDLAFHEREYHRLRADLEKAREESGLPDAPRCEAALNDLLVKVRLG